LHDRIQGPLERHRIKISAQMAKKGCVIRRAIWRQLTEVPEPLLSDGKYARLFRLAPSDAPILMGLVFDRGSH
jgi:hypothetical protein